MVAKNSGHLLTHAESILNPEVFSHPVWLRFGRKEIAASHNIIEDLLTTARTLQDDDPGNACQALFICAAYQNLTHQRDTAFKTLQKIQTLADRNSLDRVVVWVKWGMSSISFQERKYEQTVQYLEELQTILNQQKEWILANYIYVIKESLHSPQVFAIEKTNNSQNDPSSKGLWMVTFDWLEHWGAPDHKAIIEPSLEFPKDDNSGTRVKVRQFSLSTRRWQGYWQKLLLAVRKTTKGHRAKGNEKTQTKIHFPDPVKEKSVVNEEAPNLESVQRSRQISRYTSSENSVIAQMLGTFNIVIQDQPIKLPASRGLTLLKYLMLHHKQATPREVLMDIFWPDSDPDAARNNLNVAMHSLRQVLRSATENPIIRFEDGAYSLVPDMELWLDVEEFEHCVKEGRRLEARHQLTAAVTEYEIAVNLYRGDFLADNPYENWTVVDRERLRVAYLDTLDRLSQIYLNQERYTACVSLCQLILTRDRCREDAHSMLMRCYSRLGQDHLALRQYQTCVEALRMELDVTPAPETTKLYELIRQHKRV